jgi:hypothetical protein
VGVQITASQQHVASAPLIVALEQMIAATRCTEQRVSQNTDEGEKK